MNIFSRVRTPAQTPFERTRAKEIAELYKDGINPLKVEISASGGTYRYTHNDIANFLEQSKVPYDVVCSAFTEAV